VGLEQSAIDESKCLVVLPGPQINLACRKGAATVALAKPCLESVPLGNFAISEPQLHAQFAMGGTTFEQSSLSLECPAWFAVFTSSHHEKRVSQHFMQQRIENFLPLYSEVHHWTNRRKVTVQLPLFPNYVFVRIDRRQRGRVLDVPGVVSLVGCGREPTPLPECEMESLRSGLHRRKFEPYENLVVGERVRIKAGPLEGMAGFLLRKKNNLRVVITVALIQKSVAVEVDAYDVEPIAASQDPRNSPYKLTASAPLHGHYGN
jgi:transcription antitermination factor NusG